jgi:hypothetical protein
LIPSRSETLGSSCEVPVTSKGTTPAGVCEERGGRKVSVAVPVAPEVRVLNSGSIVDRVVLQVTGTGASGASVVPDSLNLAER